MKQFNKKTIRILLSLALALSIFLPMQPVKAYNTPSGCTLKYNKVITSYTSKKSNGRANTIYYYIDFGKIMNKATKVTVKSDHPSVASYHGIASSVHEGTRYPGTLWIGPKKKGATNFTVTITSGGKKYVRKFKFRVVDYTSPVSAFKLNNVNYAPKLNSNPVYYHANIKGKKAKIQITPKSGWILDHIEYSTNGDRMILTKNGSTVTFGNKKPIVTACLYNTKTHGYKFVHVCGF